MRARSDSNPYLLIRSLGAAVRNGPYPAFPGGSAPVGVPIRAPCPVVRGCCCHWLLSALAPDPERHRATVRHGSAEPVAVGLDMIALNWFPCLPPLPYGSGMASDSAAQNLITTEPTKGLAWIRSSGSWSPLRSALLPSV